MRNTIKLHFNIANQFANIPKMISLPIKSVNVIFFPIIFYKWHILTAISEIAILSS